MEDLNLLSVVTVTPGSPGMDCVASYSVRCETQRPIGGQIGGQTGLTWVLPVAVFQARQAAAPVKGLSLRADPGQAKPSGTEKPRKQRQLSRGRRKGYKKPGLAFRV